MTSSVPFLFLCGVPRSGTTLLQRMLDHHPLLCVTNDSHFIPRALEKTDKRLVQLATSGADIPLTKSLAQNAVDYHRFYRLGLDRAVVESIVAISDTYQEFVGRIYQTVAARAGKQLVGEKTPDFIRRAAVLHGLFPEAKLIHIIRDGRDVALSLRDWATPTKGPGRLGIWKRNPIGAAALWWRSLIRQWQLQTRDLPRSCHLVIRYEDLLADPPAILNNVCQFLELDYSPDMLNYHVGKSVTQTGLSAKKSWAQPKAGLRDWRRDLSAHEIEIFECLAGPDLAAFGYYCETDSRQPNPECQQLESWWNDNFHEFKCEPNEHPASMLNANG